MKLKCDICDGELMMNSGGKVAVCVCCGMNYSLDRMKEKFMELKDEPKNRWNEMFQKNDYENYWIQCTESIVIDRSKLKLMIHLIDQYEHINDGIKIYPHESFRKIFYKNDVLKLKENENILRIDHIKKIDVEYLFEELKNILNCSLKLIGIKDSMYNKISKEEDFVISCDNEEEIEIGVVLEYIGDASIIEIPEDVACFGRYQDGAPVFKNPLNVKEIHIQDNIYSLGSHAFYGCENLEEITLPENVGHIGYSLSRDDLGFSHTFDGCINLKSVKFSEKAWNDYDTCKGLFKNCVNLKEVKLPDTISCIPESTFENCENLEEITIPDKVCMISKNAFKGCKKLKKVHLPNHDMVIHPSAFKDTLYLPPTRFISEKEPKRCPVCNGKIDLWHTCKKCKRHIVFG